LGSWGGGGHDGAEQNSGAHPVSALGPPKRTRRPGGAFGASLACTATAGGGPPLQTEGGRGKEGEKTKGKEKGRKVKPPRKKKRPYDTVPHRTRLTPEKTTTAEENRDISIGHLGRAISPQAWEFFRQPPHLFRRGGGPTGAPPPRGFFSGQGTTTRGPRGGRHRRGRGGAGAPGRPHWANMGSKTETGRRRKTASPFRRYLAAGGGPRGRLEGTPRVAGRGDGRRRNHNGSDFIPGRGPGPGGKKIRGGGGGGRLRGEIRLGWAGFAGQGAEINKTPVCTGGPPPFRIFPMPGRGPGPAGLGLPCLEGILEMIHHRGAERKGGFSVRRLKMGGGRNPSFEKKPGAPFSAPRPGAGGGAFNWAMQKKKKGGERGARDLD